MSYDDMKDWVNEALDYQRAVNKHQESLIKKQQGAKKKFR